MIKHAPGWVRTSDEVIRNPALYLWTTTPATIHSKTKRYFLAVIMIASKLDGVIYLTLLTLGKRNRKFIQMIVYYK